MKKSLWAVIIVILFSITDIFGNSLVLLEGKSIKNKDFLETMAGFAHGTIDGKYILFLNNEQLEGLINSNLSPQVLKEDIDLDKIFMISHIGNTPISKSSVKINPLYQANNLYISELGRSTAEILQKEGFTLKKLEDYQSQFADGNDYDYLPSVEMEFLLDTLANFVNQDSLYHTVTRLEAFQTRHIFSDSIHAARNWIVNQFQSYGYDNIIVDTFYFNGYSCHNIRCIKTGTVEPEELIIVGAHYDAINLEQPDYGVHYAPGADDNGSGMSIVLETARLLKDIDTKKSIMFCAFSAEEYGMIGSGYLCADLHQDPYYKILFMLNFDNVGHTDDAVDEVYIYDGGSLPYRAVYFNACQRLETLIPYTNTSWHLSDHRPFLDNGYHAVGVIEGDIDLGGYHTDNDISSRMDFDYLKKVAQLAVMAAGHIDFAPTLTPITDIWDVGDGQGLLIEWNESKPYYEYNILYGTSSGNYTDTINLGAIAENSYLLTGLTEGTTYFITVVASDQDHYPPILVSEVSMAPNSYPRAPEGVNAYGNSDYIYLVWETNPELDLNHYELTRRPSGGMWQIIDVNLTDTFYNDYTADDHIEYEYQLIAVDNDLLHSEMSNIATAVIASFDWPLLYIDETASDGTLNPSETEQTEFYEDFLFDEIMYNKFEINQYVNGVTKSTIGQYKTVFWIDDDIASHYFNVSQDSISWFLHYTTNFVLAGWEPVFWSTGNSYVYPGEFFYDNFGIYQVTNNSNFDFIGAFGQNGWPDLTVDTDNIFAGHLSGISVFGTIPGAEVIYTYNSLSDDGAFENMPCGIMYNDGTGINIALAFPIYHLTDESAKLLTNKIFDVLGIERHIIYGDVNNDNVLNILDIIYVINYLYKNGAPPVFLNNADVNGDCTISILDIVYMISFIYKGGAQPLPGCVL